MRSLELINLPLSMRRCKSRAAAVAGHGVLAGPEGETLHNPAKVSPHQHTYTCVHTQIGDKVINKEKMQQRTCHSLACASGVNVEHLVAKSVFALAQLWLRDQAAWPNLQERSQ